MLDVPAPDEGQVQAATRCHSTPISLTVIKARPKGQCVLARMWGEEGPVHLLGGCGCGCQHLERRRRVTTGPSSSTPGWEQNGDKSPATHNSAQLGREFPRQPFSWWLQGKWPPGTSGGKKNWFGHTVEYPSALGRTGVLELVALRCPRRTSVSYKMRHQSSVSAT